MSAISHAQALIEANTQAHTVDGYTAFHMVADAHERTIRELCARLAEFTGKALTPQTGCHFSTVQFCDRPLLVEMDVENGRAYPVNVLHNGAMVDAQDFFGERWESYCTDCEDDDSDAQRDYRRDSLLDGVFAMPAFPSVRVPA